jgi:hypothetical protein
VLARIPQADLQVYAVWIPVLMLDVKTAVPQATKWVPDVRVHHYWDGQSSLVAEYARTLGTNERPWDVFFLYGRDAEWKDGPPKPAYWMDQIGMENGTPFDASKLAEQTRELLNQQR